MKNKDTLLKIRISCLAIAALLFSGCSVMNSGPKDGGKAVTIESVRGPAPVGIQTQERDVKREEYQKALGREGSVNSARLVEIYTRGKVSDDLKEYRLLDVQPGSAYDLLGLEHADVVIAADGFVIPTPQMFWSYLNLISKFDEGNIEIRRLDQPMLVKFKLM